MHSSERKEFSNNHDRYDNITKDFLVEKLGPGT